MVTDIQRGKGHAPEEQALRTLLVCGDDPVRLVLGWILAEDARFDLVGSVARGDHAAAWTDPLDAALVDMAVPGLDAFATVRALLQQHPAMTPVVLGHVDVPYLRAASMEAGAAGYIDRSGLDGPAVVEQLAQLCQPRSAQS